MRGYSALHFPYMSTAGQLVADEIVVISLYDDRVSLNRLKVLPLQSGLVRKIEEMQLQPRA